jgi:hypothetical protein
VGATGKRERERGVDWFDVTQSRDQYRAVINTVMNLRVRF